VGVVLKIAVTNVFKVGGGKIGTIVATDSQRLVEPVDGTGFHLWKLRMRMLLLERTYW
jgi:hypothetical protein